MSLYEFWFGKPEEFENIHPPKQIIDIVEYEDEQPINYDLAQQDLSELPAMGVIVVFGKRGKGKSTCIRWLISENMHRTFFVYDAFDEYDIPGAMYYTSIDQFLRTPVLGHVHVFRGEIEPNKFFELTMHFENIVIVFDEVDLACHAGYIGTHLYRVVNYGRHNGNLLICGARRPADISRNITSNAWRIIIFNLTEDRDLMYIRKNLGDEYATRARKLRIGECIVWPQNPELEER